MSEAVGDPITLPAITTEVMEALYQHRLLSSAQIHQLHTPQASMSWTRRLLAALAGAGLIAHTSGGGRLKLWYLTGRGSEAVESITTLAEVRRRQVTPEQAAGPLRAHTLAVNEVGLCFVKAARARGDDCGPLSWRHEIAHALSQPRARKAPELLIADALLTYTQRLHDGSLVLHRRFIELDRATIPVQALAEKFARYARLRDYAPQPEGHDARAPAWREQYAEFPGVLVVFTTRARASVGQRASERATLQRRMQNTIALHRSDHRARELAVLLVLLDELRACGPFAPIFIDPRHPEHYVNWLGETATPQR